MTATIEEKLYEIFANRLDQIEDDIAARISPRWRSVQKLHEEWEDFLSDVPGVESISKIMSLVLQQSDDKVWVRNPLVIGGNEGIISMPKETAIKIVTLGHIPQEEQK